MTRAAFQDLYYNDGNPPGAWVAAASCASADPELFFPDYSAGLGSGRAAKRVCNTCPVIDDCRAYAMSADWLVGIWGGLTARERTLLRRRTK